MTTRSSPIETTSKFLSLVLRHAPQTIGLSLDGSGWASVDELISLANRNGRKLDRSLLEAVVATSDKKRFALSKDRSRIRASQGHSVAIDLGLQPISPPDVLFHGTADRFLSSILSTGLNPGKRRHVHLSSRIEVARTVGSRHGRPIVLAVDASAMRQVGHDFYHSDNDVWLTDSVPAQYLQRHGGNEI